MYTVCPKCALTLVVTAADLRVAQGFVRCGRCSNVFNALARLSEDRSASSVGVASPTLSHPAPPQPPPEPEPPPPQPQPSTGEADSIPDTALEFDPEATDVSKVFIERAPDPQWTAATGKFKALLKRMQPAHSPSQAGAPWPDSAPAQPNTPESGAAQTSQPNSRSRAAPAAQPATPQPGASQPGASRASPSQAGAVRASAPQGLAAPSSPTQSVQRAPAPPSSSTSSAPASQATPPPATPKTIPTDEDAQFDIEVDA